MSLNSQSSYDDVYKAAIANGCTPGMADMLASRQSPALHGGDTYYLAGKGTLAKQFEGAEDQLDYITKTAKRKGYNPGVNDVYESALASYPGDPAAFVPPSGGISHIRHICEERDLSCTGAFKRTSTTKGSQVDAESKPFIDKKLYKKLSRKMIAENPDLGKKSRREIKEAVYDKHAFKG